MSVFVQCCVRRIGTSFDVSVCTYTLAGITGMITNGEGEMTLVMGARSRGGECSLQITLPCQRAVKVGLQMVIDFYCFENTHKTNRFDCDWGTWQKRYKNKNIIIITSKESRVDHYNDD